MEPTKVAGSTVERATLHNAHEVARKDVRPGRHRRAAQGGRRDPRDRRPGAGAATEGPQEVGDADRVSLVRHDAGPAEGGRQGPPLPQHPGLPGPAARAGLPRGEPRRVRHRGPRLRGGARAARRRGDLRRGRRVRPRPRRSCSRPTCSPAPPRRARTARSSAPTARVCWPTSESGKQVPAVAGAGRAVDPTRRADRGPGAGHRVRLDGRDPGGVGGAAGRGRGGRPDHRRVGDRVVRRRLAPRDRRQVGGGRGQHGRRARRVDAAHPRGPDHRRHRFTGRLLPRLRQGGDRVPRRQGGRLGVEEHRLRRGRRQRRHPRPTRPSSSVCRSSTRARFKVLLESGPEGL